MADDCQHAGAQRKSLSLDNLSQLASTLDASNLCVIKNMCADSHAILPHIAIFPVVHGIRGDRVIDAFDPKNIMRIKSPNAFVDWIQLKSHRHFANLPAL